MIRFKILTIPMSILIFSFASYAGMVPQVKVEGVIVRMTPKTVKLYRNGRYVNVPRSAIPKYFKIKSGEKVFAVIDSSIIKKKIKLAQKLSNKK